MIIFQHQAVQHLVVPEKALRVKGFACRMPFEGHRRVDPNRFEQAGAGRGGAGGKMRGSAGRQSGDQRARGLADAHRSPAGMVADL